MIREFLLFLALVLALYFIAQGSLGMVILLVIFVVLVAITKKEEYSAEKKQEEARAKLEETLDNRYPEVFYSSSVLLSDPKWAPSVRFGDAFMLDLLHHLMFKVREIDKGIQSGEISGPSSGGFYGSSKPSGKPFTEFLSSVAQSYKQSSPSLLNRGEPLKLESSKDEQAQQQSSQSKPNKGSQESSQQGQQQDSKSEDKQGGS